MKNVYLGLSDSASYTITVVSKPKVSIEVTTGCGSLENYYGPKIPVYVRVRNTDSVNADVTIKINAYRDGSKISGTYIGNKETTSDTISVTLTPNSFVTVTAHIPYASGRHTYKISGKVTATASGREDFSKSYSKECTYS